MNLFSENHSNIQSTKSRVIKSFILKDGAKRKVVDDFRKVKSNLDFQFDENITDSIA